MLTANIELAFQNKEKERRAEELIIANQELAFQNKEKEQRAKELIMSKDQEANWQKLVARVAPALRELKALNDHLHAAGSVSAAAMQAIQDVTLACRDLSAGLSCSIATIAGETTVRTLKVRPGQAALHTLPPRALRMRLHESDADHETVFSDSDGEFAWMFAPDDISTDEK